MLNIAWLLLENSSVLDYKHKSSIWDWVKISFKSNYPGSYERYAISKKIRRVDYNFKSDCLPF